MFESFFERRTSGIALGLFRIGLASVMLGEAAQLAFFYDLVFLPLGERQLDVEPWLLLVLWTVALLFLIAGFFTRYAALANYLCVVSLLSGFKEFEYHIDYIYVSTSLLLVFAPIGARLSLDSALSSLRHDESAKGKAISIPFAWNIAIIVISVGFVYWDSCFHKAGSPMWKSGLGVWLPASMPTVTYLDLTYMLNQKWVMLSLGYFVFAFEALFLFLIWFRRFHVYLLVIGIGLHVGILVAFSIPFFALAVAFCYVLIIPDEWFRVFQHSDPVSSSETTEQQNGWSTAKGLVVVLAVAFCLQSLCTIRAPIFRLLPSGVKPGLVYFRDISRMVEASTAPFTGLRQHPVFMHSHFDNYNHVISVSYRKSDGSDEVTIPITQEDGQTGVYASGRFMVWYTFRVVSPQIEQGRLEAGLERLCYFWASKNGIAPSQGEFVVRVKQLEVPTSWQKNFLRDQLQHPWHEVGVIRWSDGKFETDLPMIEEYEFPDEILQEEN